MIREAVEQDHDAWFLIDGLLQFDGFIDFLCFERGLSCCT